MSEFEKNAKEYKKNKQKWIIKNDFKKYVDKATVNRALYIPNYVNLTPFDPPANHKFRSISKEKWICNNNFYV